MKFSRNAALSCQILAAHKLRTALSVGGVVVGVAVVIVMVSVGQGAEKRILDRVRAMGTNVVIVNAAPARQTPGRARQSTLTTALDLADAEAIAAECASVLRAVPSVSRTLTANWGGNQAATTVVGMTAEGFSARRISVRTGRAFDAEDDRAKRRVAVVGRTVVENLFRGSDPVDQQVRLGRIAFEVIGVAVPRGTDANGTDQDDIILIPLGTAMRRLLNVHYVQTIHVQAESSEVLGRVARDVRDLLRQRHRLPEGRPDPFTIQNQMELMETQREAARSMTLLIGSVAGIALLVGGVGILAVMLISVRERVHEIGLRRALGARRSDITVQFITESALLAGAGGALGVLAGVAATLGLSLLTAWETVLSWSAAAAGVLFSLGVGIGFGLYPAVRAARLEPIQALRSE